eukprot:7565026-Alexandrium_andersonii.AAC.1
MTPRCRGNCAIPKAPRPLTWSQQKASSANMASIPERTRTRRCRSVSRCVCAPRGYGGSMCLCVP